MADLAIGLSVTTILVAVGFAFGRANERAHLKNLQQREMEFTAMAQSTENLIPDNWRIRRAELVCGSVVIASDYFKFFASRIKSIFGGELRAFETLLARGRREAHLRMLEQARAIGANAVWRIRMETATIGRGAGDKGLPCAEVFVYGTALVVEPKPSNS